jgi:hypothetical protein
MLRRFQRGDQLLCIEPAHDLVFNGLYRALEDEYRLTVCVEGPIDQPVCPGYGYEVWRFQVTEVTDSTDVAGVREAMARFEASVSAIEDD